MTPVDGTDVPRTGDTDVEWRVRSGIGLMKNSQEGITFIILYMFIC